MNERGHNSLTTDMYSYQAAFGDLESFRIDKDPGNAEYVGTARAS